MSLKAKHQQMLAATERALRASDPQLTALLDFFARLHRHEEMPRREEIRRRLTDPLAASWSRICAATAGPRRRFGLRARTAVFLPLALALIAASFALSPRQGGSGGCGRRPAATQRARISGALLGCQPDLHDSPLANMPVGK